VKAFYNITDWKTTNIQRADSLFTVMREASTEKKQGKKKKSRSASAGKTCRNYVTNN